MTNTLAYYLPALQQAVIFNTDPMLQNFYGHNLRMFVISQSVGHSQTFPVQSNVCGYSNDAPYMQAPNPTHKHQATLEMLVTCQGKILHLIMNINTLRMKFFLQHWSQVASDSIFYNAIHPSFVPLLVFLKSIRINQLPLSVTRWQHGNQICFATFIW